VCARADAPSALALALSSKPLLVALTAYLHQELDFLRGNRFSFEICAQGSINQLIWLLGLDGDRPIHAPPSIAAIPMESRRAAARFPVRWGHVFSAAKAGQLTMVKFLHSITKDAEANIQAQEQKVLAEQRDQLDAETRELENLESIKSGTSKETPKKRHYEAQWKDLKLKRRMVKELSSKWRDRLLDSGIADAAASGGPTSLSPPLLI